MGIGFTKVGELGEVDKLLIQRFEKLIPCCNIIFQKILGSLIEIVNSTGCEDKVHGAEFDFAA